jgi:rhodanese-related sulfurtransferase
MDETVSAAELERMRASGTPLVILDVRRQVDFDADDVMIPGARRADPELIDVWSQTLDPNEAIVIYCVRGGSVSRALRASLTERGFNVRYIDGGIAAWKAHGGLGVAKDPA